MGSCANAALGALFAEQFDSYGSCTSAPCSCTINQSLYEANWMWDSSRGYPGTIRMDYQSTCPSGFKGWSPPFSWRGDKTTPVQAWKSLIPYIRDAAADLTKNAINGSSSSPLVVTFHMWLDLSGKQNDTALWLELVGQDSAGKCDDTAGTCVSNVCSNNGAVCATSDDCAATNVCIGGFNAGNTCSSSYDCVRGDTFAAPVKVPGTTAGVCGSGGTCTAGATSMIGKTCYVNSDCDEPMKFTGGYPTCNLGNSTPSVPRPSLAYGVYGGYNGLMPKDSCGWLREVDRPVIFDGNQWTILKASFPAGSSATGLTNTTKDTIVTLTIRDTDLDITLIQNGSGTCANSDGTCTVAAAGTCVSNVCTNNSAACTVDADCNVCTGGVHAGAVCASDTDCRDAHVCVGGTNAGNPCTITAQCNRDTNTKTGIPRQYQGPFQAIAMGSGRIYDGTGTYWGSQYAGFIDDIEINGGVYLTVPTGACCLNGTCLESTIEVTCQQLGGTWAGSGSTCASAPCSHGACCTAQGCVTDKTQTECETPAPAGLGGVFQGIASTCENRVCCPKPFADADWDGDVDQDDFGAFQVCYTGTTTGIPTGCDCFNRVADNVIDGPDLNAFLNCFTGPNVPWSQAVTPNCTP